MREYKGYQGTFGPDDGHLAGRVVGIRDVITFVGQTEAEIEHAFRDSIDNYLDFCSEREEPPEQPLTPPTRERA
jgi:predicted HicB family RNase H-like nuclease